MNAFPDDCCHWLMYQRYRSMENIILRRCGNVFICSPFVIVRTYLFTYLNIYETTEIVPFQQVLGCATDTEPRSGNDSERSMATGLFHLKTSVPGCVQVDMPQSTSLQPHSAVERTARNTSTIMRSLCHQLH